MDPSQAVLEGIRRSIRTHGSPPTLRELARALGWRSTNSVRYHLRKLEREGLIRRFPGRARGFHPVETSRGRDREAWMGKGIPVLGRVAAGVPVLAEENWEAMLPVDARGFRSGADFALRVQGDSMSGAGILEGDLVVVRGETEPASGEIVVAMLDGETTVKRFRRRGVQILLQPENPAYRPIPIGKRHDVRILGVVTGLLRMYSPRGSP
ncbi:MAG: transcriptional repressor LexA [Candidatus Eisenbacteria bacterium]|nr:transcriptional repressor LexA [Candidatus Eisenbacteria bacterium]